MTFLPAQQLSTPFEDYPNQFLKCFLQGTTTPLSMATDSTGGTLLAKAEISGGGTPPIGFIKTAGGAIFQVYLDAPFDAWIFPTASEADANDTSNAIQIANNINLELINADVSKTYGTVAEMVADEGLSVGDFVVTAGYSTTGDGGGNGFEIVASGTGTADGGSFIDLDTHQAKGLFPGDIIQALQFGAKGDGITVDTTASQALAAFTDDVYFPDTGNTYILNDRLLFERSGVTVRGDGETQLKWTTLGAARQVGTPASRWTQGANIRDGIRVEGSSFTLKDIVLQGNDVATYVGANNMVVITGDSSSSRQGGAIIENVEIFDVGDRGIWFSFFDNIVVKDCFLHNIAFYGGIFFSCTNIKFKDNLIKTIFPGTAGNMYGVSFTHDSTAYSTDPNAGTLQAEAPFCSEVEVSGNHVEDVNWEGIDFHGAYNSHVHHNKVYNTKLGISVTTSSGDALNYAGYSNNVNDNIVDGRNADGTTSGRENLAYGILISGGSVLPHINVLCSDNIILFKGLINNPNTGALNAAAVDGCVISDNIIDKWMGQALYINASTSMTVSDNMFGGKAAATADSADIVIRDASSSSTSKVNITGNVLDVGTGNAPNIGFRASNVTARIKLSDNDFEDAATPNILAHPGFATGNDVLTTVKPEASDTTPSVDIGSSQALLVLVEFNPTAGNVTVTNLDDAVNGQRFLLVNTHASNTVTFTRSNAVLDGGASQVMNQFDQFIIRYDGIRFIQESPMSDNS